MGVWRLKYFYFSDTPTSPYSDTWAWSTRSFFPESSCQTILSGSKVLSVQTSGRQLLTSQIKYDRRTLSAYHEAGHAVVAYDQGVRVHGISIVPDEGRMGHIAIDTLLLNQLAPTFQTNKGARNRFTMERHVMVLQGGHAAVNRLVPDSRELADTVNSEGSDRNIAMSLLEAFASGNREAEKYYQWLDARTEGIMANPMRWHQVEALVNALLNEGSLGARRVRMVIKDAGERWVRENQESGVRSQEPRNTSRLDD